MSQSKDQNQEPSQNHQVQKATQDQAQAQLTALWADIDEVDHSLLALLESRLEIYREIKQQLEALDEPYDLATREAEILEQLLELTHDQTLKTHLPALYHTLTLMTSLQHSGLATLSQHLESQQEVSNELITNDETETPLPRRKMTRLISKQLDRFKWRQRNQQGAARTAPLNAQQRAWITSRGFAHRGLHNALEGIAENSLEAFEAAITHGYGIELDVHLSRDGIPIVFHDEDLARMTGAQGEVSDFSLAELQKLKLIPSNARIPTLSEVLELIDGREPVLVEIKNHGKPVGPIEEAVYQVIKKYRGPLCVQSFNPMSLSWFLRNAPQVLRGLISYSFPVEEVPLKAPTRFLLKNLLFTPICRPHYIAYRHSDIIRHRLRRLHRLRARGTPVLAWTILTQDEANLAYRRVDNVIFEGFKLEHTSSTAPSSTTQQISSLEHQSS